MSDDPNEQLRRLSAFADEDPDGPDLLDDPRWQELAEGRASEDTVAELKRLADEAGMPQAMEMFAPLSDATTERIEASVASLTEDGGAASEPAPVVSLDRRRRASRMVGLLAALAMAAMLALWLGRAPEPGSGVWPSYTMTLEGGERMVRSVAEPRRYRAGGVIELSLRPERRVEHAPVIRVWLRGRDRLVPLSGRFEVAESGALRFRGRLPSTLPAEPVTLWLVLGNAGSLPPADADGGTLDELGPEVRLLTAPLPLVEDDR